MKKISFLTSLLMSIILTNGQIITYPYNESWETGNNGWSTAVNSAGLSGIVTPSTLQDWGRGNPTSKWGVPAHSGTNAWMSNINGLYTNNSVYTLTSPVFDLTSLTQPTLQFWMVYETEYNWDEVIVEYSVNNSAWLKLNGYYSTSDWYCCFYNNQNPFTWSTFGYNWMGSNGGWAKYKTDISSLKSYTDVRFRFTLHTDWGLQYRGVLIDDFSIYDNLSLNCVGNKTVNTDVGVCSATVTNIDPIISPANAVVHYKIDREGEEIESGTGSVSGKSFSKGVTTVTYTSADEPSKTCSFTIAVEDHEKPKVVTKNITVQLDGNGSATITPLQVNNGSTDNCSIAVNGYSLDNSTFDCSNVGQNTVTLTVTDVEGNSNSKTAIVTVEDNVKPTVITQNITVQLDQNGSATIIPSQIDNGSTDNCSIGGSGYSLSKASFDCSDIGQNTVTLTVTDVNGNSNSNTATVTVEDKIKPTVITKNITVQLDENGSATITPLQINNGSTDNCSIAPDGYSLDNVTFDCSNVGPNTVTLTVTDVHRNSDSKTSTVTVEDNVRPTVITQNITVQLDENGSASIIPSQIDNGSSDNCSISGYSLNKTTFNCSDVGSNTITLTVTDVNGNSDSKTATVTVQDKIKPTVITQNITVQLDQNGSAIIDPLQINNGSTDNCSIASGGYSLSKTTFNCTNVGANTVTLTVTDVNGNSDSKTATVTVQDKVKPTVITQNITVQLNASGMATIVPSQIDNNSYDNCTIANYSLDKTVFNCASVGSNTVTLTVTDVNGNSDSKTATVAVQDNIKPTVVTQNITVQLNVAGSATILASQINNGSYDNCTIASGGYSLSKSTFSCSDVGQNSVTLTVTDVNGNSDSKTAIVTVQDNIKPVASCKSISVYLGLDGTATITPQQVDNGSSDACGVSLSLDKTSFNTSNVGPNTVTLTVTDPSGNSSSCTATVTIQKRPTVIVYKGDGSEQYSDQQSLTAELRDQLTNTVLSSKLVSFNIGSQSASGTTNTSGIASANLILTQDPTPTYTVKSAFAGDAIFLQSNDEDAFDILQEDARAYYTGSLFASTGTGSTATITLSATIRDITAETGDPYFDNFAGDIRNAKVTFIDRSTNAVIATVPVGLVNAGDTKTGTATYNWPVNIGSANSNDYTIGIVVSNYYTRNASSENTVVTVSKSMDDFITGGGYIKVTSSAGLKAGDAGTNNNFGFNVKFNKAKTNLQGHINTIIRRTEPDGLHVYQVNGNSMTSLAAATATATTPGTATFNGKANIQDITNPLVPPVPIDGNAQLQVTMTDNGEPGTYDAIAITVWNKNGGLWFASNWDGIKTPQQTLAGGNLKVNTGSPNPGSITNALTLASSSNPSMTGQLVTFKATVVETNSAVPGGYIMFMDGTTVLGNVVVSTVGSVTSASLSISALTAGAHQVKAYYSGDSKFASSVGTLTQTVNATVTLARNIATSNTREKKYDVDFEVIASPNPANYFFNVTIRSNDQEEKIGLKVVDVLGRVVENRGTVTEGKTFKIGESYRPGIYFVEIIQGKERRILKLIKQSE